MKAKKFTCPQCGAPKVNPYEGVYVFCDYCSELIDIDATASFLLAHRSGDQRLNWERLQSKYQDRVYSFRDKEDAVGLKKFLISYYREFYKLFPFELPINVPNGKKYNEYLDALADLTTQTIMVRDFRKIKGKYEYLFISMRYYKKNGRDFLDNEQFDKMIEAYLEYLDMEMKLMFGGDYPILAQQMPEAMVRKVRISHIAQRWVPLLEDIHADAFFDKYSMKHEYVEIQTPVIDKLNCKSCQKELSVPKGAIRKICEDCRHDHIFQSTINCHSCAMENKFPENWANTINCKSCGSELRIVQTFFE